MAGKHTRQQTQRRNWVAATAALVAVVTAGAVWMVLNDTVDVAGAVARATSSSSSTTSTSTTATTGTTATSSPTSSQTASTTSSQTPSATTKTADPAVVKAQRSLAACRTGVAQRERLAEAAAATARDWRAHTDAQRKLESGDLTPAKAEAVWDTTTKRGSDDTKRFNAAAAKVRGSSGAANCRSVAADTAKTPLAKKGARCAARVTALAAVASTGAVLNSQWAAHLKMMADKPHTNDAVYHDRWVTMVAQAQTPLKRYAAASKTLSRTPACSA